MRTPGEDEELVIGFLHSEGVIESADCFSSVVTSDDRVVVKLNESTDFDPEELTRRTTMTSSCGICGKDSISNLLHIHGPELSNSFTITHDAVGKAVSGLRATGAGDGGAAGPGARGSGGISVHWDASAWDWSEQYGNYGWEDNQEYQGFYTYDNYGQYPAEVTFLATHFEEFTWV